MCVIMSPVPPLVGRGGEEEIDRAERGGSASALRGKEGKGSRKGEGGARGPLQIT